MQTRIISVAVAATALLPQVAWASSLDDCLSLDPKQAQACASRINPYARIYRDQQGQLGVTSNATVKGAYADYISAPGDMSSPLLSKVLENDGLVLIAKAGPVDAEDLAYELDLKAVPDRSANARGAFMLSTQGPDVSGRDILTWYHKQRFAGGYVATVSATHGFSDLRPESKGGSYESVFLDLEKAFTFGLANLSYSYTDNEAGGDSLIYVLGGKTQRFGASLTNWHSRNWKFMQKLEHTTRKQEMGVFDLYTRQRYTSGILEGGYETDAATFMIKAKKGMDGNQELNLIPLLGAFNPYFWSLDVTAKGQLKLADNLVLKGRVEGFKGSIDMPSSERFGLGGMGAGSSHESGLYSGYKGVQNDLSLHYLVYAQDGITASAKLGTNGAEIRTALDEKIRLQSAEVGFDLGFGNWGISTTYAKSVMTHGLEADQRVNAQLVWRY